MKCPSCGVAVEDGADLCLECGEPMGDSPVAHAVRSEKLPAPAASPSPASTAPSTPAARPRARREEEPETVRCPGCGIPTQKERCPGCGTRIHRSDD